MILASPYGGHEYANVFLEKISVKEVVGELGCSVVVDLKNTDSEKNVDFHYVKNLKYRKKNIFNDFLNKNLPQYYRLVNKYICDWFNEHTYHTHYKILKEFL